MYYYGNSNKVTLTNLMIQDSNNKPENIKIELVDVPSYDGTLVPMTIFYNSDIKLNGNNPLIIEAYGCYGYTYSPRYNPVRNIWLNRGGIFAIAHVRGGGEKGEEWYRAGYKATKPNTWKDLICCSEYLIEKGYTSSKKLAVIGTSCGAIAAGRAITERPDLFKAAVISIGSLNNLRHEEGKTNSNIAEYGSIGDSLGFRYLFEMDVYHHIQDSVKYPSFLFSSGMNDPRLSPWQTGKVVAKLQEISKEYDNIILYHISDEGHSRFSESSDSFSFLFWQLGYPEFKLNFNKFNNKK